MPGRCRQAGVLGVEQLGDRAGGRHRPPEATRAWTQVEQPLADHHGGHHDWRAGARRRVPGLLASATSCAADRALVPPPMAARSLRSMVRRTAQPPPSSPMRSGLGHEDVVEEHLVEVVAARHLTQRTDLDRRPVLDMAKHESPRRPGTPDRCGR